MKNYLDIILHHLKLELILRRLLLLIQEKIFQMYDIIINRMPVFYPFMMIKLMNYHLNEFLP